LRLSVFVFNVMKDNYRQALPVDIDPKKRAVFFVIGFTWVVIAQIFKEEFLKKPMDDFF